MHSVNNTERVLHKICPVQRQSLQLCEKGNNTTAESPIGFRGLALHIKLFHLPGTLIFIKHLCTI
jgi:hypothetical protein